MYMQSTIRQKTIIENINDYSLYYNYKTCTIIYNDHNRNYMMM